MDEYKPHTAVDQSLVFLLHTRKYAAQPRRTYTTCKRFLSTLWQEMHGWPLFKTAKISVRFPDKCTAKMREFQGGSVFVYSCMPSCVFWLTYHKHIWRSRAVGDSSHTNFVCVCCLCLSVCVRVACMYLYLHLCACECVCLSLPASQRAIKCSSWDLSWDWTNLASI